MLFRLHYHIIQVNVGVSAEFLEKALLHATLKGGVGIPQAERHGQVAEGSKGSDERRLLLVLNCHLDLMITRISIQETPLTTHRSINDLINTGESERISQTSLI